jgi:hypothetical protein
LRCSGGHGFFLVEGCWFLGILVVESLSGFFCIVEIPHWVPSFILVMKPFPLHSILKYSSVVVRISDFFNFPLFFVIDDDRGSGRLKMSGDGGILIGCGFEERDVEHWVYSHAGGKV